MTTTQIILVRHGATSANLKQPYTLQGSKPDSELAEIGVLQARVLANDLARYRIDQAYTSPLCRARQTANILCEKAQINLQIKEGLIEVDVGHWAGLTWDVIHAQWPKESTAFQENAEQYPYLGGENLNQVRDRVLPVINDIVRSHQGKSVLIVSHGVVNRVLLAHWMNIPPRYARNLPQDNTGYNVIEFDRDKVKVRMINYAEHLRQLS